MTDERTASTQGVPAQSLLCHKHHEPGHVCPYPRVLPFGTHAALDSVPPLTFSDEVGDDLLPLYETHAGCTCTFPDTSEEIAADPLTEKEATERG